MAIHNTFIGGKYRTLRGVCMNAFHHVACRSASSLRAPARRRRWQSVAAVGDRRAPVAAADGHRRPAEPAAARRPAALAGRPATSSIPASEADWKSGRRDLAHLARARGRRRAGAAHERRRRRDRPALVARRQDDRVHREARRQRVRADLPAAGRRRRGAPADDACQRGVGHHLGAGRAALYFIAPEAEDGGRKDARAARDDVYAYDENYKQTHLWKVPSRSKAETRITDGDFSVTAYDLSDDGRKIAYHRAPTPLLGDGDEGEVWVANADGSSAVQLTKNTVQENGARDLAGRLAGAVHLRLERALRDLLQRPLFVVPAAGGRRACSSARTSRRRRPAVWSKDGKSIYFLANLGVHEELFVVPAAGGKPRQLTDGKHNIGVAWSQSTAIGWRFTLSDSTSAGDIWTMRPATPRRRESRTSSTTRARLQARTPGSDSVERRRRRDRRRAPHLSGRLSAGQKYPLAVMTHGGPQAADKYSLGSIVLRDPGAGRQGLRRACSRTTAAAPATATRSCAT